MKTSELRCSTGSLSHTPNALGRVFKHLAQVWLVIAVVWAMPACLLAEEAKIEHETGFYYTIKKGDTLWDLSKRFSDSPWLWPDLWQKNKQIANPHWIYPGERIRLYRKAGIREVTEAVAPEPLAAAPEIEPPYFFYSGMQSISFIKKEPIPPNGIIVKAYGKGNLLATGDKVYIRAQNESTFARGSRYTAYRETDPEAGLTAKHGYGIQYKPTGVVEIITEQSGYVAARIIHSYHTMEIGDTLLPYQKRSGKIVLRPSRQDLSGKIIGSQEHEKLIADRSIVFIDKGGQDGVMPGQQYTVYYREKNRLDAKKALEIGPASHRGFRQIHCAAHRRSNGYVLCYPVRSKHCTGNRLPCRRFLKKIRTDDLSKKKRSSRDDRFFRVQYLTQQSWG